jgi:hypothetical protein
VVDGAVWSTAHGGETKIAVEREVGGLRRLRRLGRLKGLRRLKGIAELDSKTESAQKQEGYGAYSKKCLMLCCRGLGLYDLVEICSRTYHHTCQQVTGFAPSIEISKWGSYSNEFG